MIAELLSSIFSSIFNCITKWRQVTLLAPKLLPPVQTFLLVLRKLSRAAGKRAKTLKKSTSLSWMPIWREWKEKWYKSCRQKCSFTFFSEWENGQENIGFWRLPQTISEIGENHLITFSCVDFCGKRNESWGKELFNYSWNAHLFSTNSLRVWDYLLGLTLSFYHEHPPWKSPLINWKISPGIWVNIFYSLSISKHRYIINEEVIEKLVYEFRIHWNFMLTVESSVL